jgi:large subunit ribosomal protein L31
MGPPVTLPPTDCKLMKKDIHPQYNSDAQVTCACGNSFVVGSTLAKIETELCSKCHPFYTGKQKIIDSARRVEKFQDREAKKTDNLVSKTSKRAERAKKQKEKREEKEKADIVDTTK